MQSVDSAKVLSTELVSFHAGINVRAARAGGVPRGGGFIMVLISTSNCKMVQYLKRQSFFSFNSSQILNDQDVYFRKRLLLRPESFKLSQRFRFL